MVGQKEVINWYSPLIASHATHRILLPFTILICDLGIELCSFSAKLCGCNFVTGMLNGLSLWYQHQLVTIHLLLHLPKQLFGKMNLYKNSAGATLQTENMQRMINEFLDDDVPSENVITSLDSVEIIFKTTAKRCFKIKTTTKRRQ